jgi:hypothetical protein
MGHKRVHHEGENAVDQEVEVLPTGDLELNWVDGEVTEHKGWHNEGNSDRNVERVNGVVDNFLLVFKQELSESPAEGSQNSETKPYFVV